MRGEIPRADYRTSLDAMPAGAVVDLSSGLHSKTFVFCMSGNPESKTSLLDVIFGVQHVSWQRALAGHLSLPKYQLFLR